MALSADRRGWGPGYPVDRRHDMVTVTVANAVRLVVHKRVAPIFKAFCDEIDAHGYDLDGVADDWGYANRPIRGSRKPSNHSWGLAVDLNATKNPMAATLKTDIPAWVVELAENKYGLSWGGRYRTRPDAMHFEFLGTPADADRVIARLTHAPNVPVAVPRRPTSEETLIDMIAKDDTDAIRAFVRQSTLELLLRQPSPEELGRWVQHVEDSGAEALITTLADSAEGKKVRAAQRKLLGV
jgi:hypothetical protein